MTDKDLTNVNQPVYTPEIFDRWIAGANRVSTDTPTAGNDRHRYHTFTIASVQWCYDYLTLPLGFNPVSTGFLQ